MEWWDPMGAELHLGRTGKGLARPVTPSQECVCRTKGSPRRTCWGRQSQGAPGLVGQERDSLLYPGLTRMTPSFPQRLSNKLQNSEPGLALVPQLLSAPQCLVMGPLPSSDSQGPPCPPSS